MPLCVYLSEGKFNFVLVSAAHILKSIGIKRGKNDKADSKDIARFAYLHQQDITCCQLPEKQLAKLKLLLSHRERLIRAKKMFDTASGEADMFLSKNLTKEIIKDSRSLIKTLEKKIKHTDTQISELVQSDEKLQQACELASSVPGVGLQTAHHLIVVSRCFTSFQNARQLACYAGVAPFEYSSGSSIRRPRARPGATTMTSRTWPSGSTRAPIRRPACTGSNSHSTTSSWRSGPTSERRHSTTGVAFRFAGEGIDEAHATRVAADGPRGEGPLRDVRCR